MDAASHPRLRVLCADDNRDLTDSAVEFLRLVGFDAVACYDGPHALAAAREFIPDICLLDLNMPGMEGDELAGRLREEAGSRVVVFVAITAHGDDESRGRTAAAGFNVHLVKPVDPRHLLQIMESLGVSWTGRKARYQSNESSDLDPLRMVERASSTESVSTQISEWLVGADGSS